MKLSDQEIKRLHYHSFILQANHAFVNGFSGYQPQAWQNTISDLRKFPQQLSLTTIKQLGVDLIIIHHQDVNQLYLLDPFTIPLAKMLSILNQNPDFVLAYQDQQTTVYQTQFSGL